MSRPGSMSRSHPEQLAFDFAAGCILGRPLPACPGSDESSPIRTPSGPSVSEPIAPGQKTAPSHIFRRTNAIHFGSLERASSQHLGDGCCLYGRIYGCYGDPSFRLSFETAGTRMARSSTGKLLARPPPEGNRAARFRARTSKSSSPHYVSRIGFYGFDPNVPAKNIRVDFVESPLRKDLANDTT